jgi:hypothetical protein
MFGLRGSCLKRQHRVIVFHPLVYCEFHPISRSPPNSKSNRYQCLQDVYAPIWHWALILLQM